MTDPTFDPNQHYDVADVPRFDPSAPYEDAEHPTAAIPLVRASTPAVTPQEAPEVGAPDKTFDQAVVQPLLNPSISPENRRALGGDGPIKALRPITDLLPDVVDLAGRGMAAGQGLLEQGALGMDRLIDATGLNDVAKKYLPGAIHPGAAAMALMEAFPDFGSSSGIHTLLPTQNLDGLAAQQGDAAIAAGIKAGKSTDEVMDIAKAHGLTPDRAAVEANVAYHVDHPDADPKVFHKLYQEVQDFKSRQTPETTVENPQVPTPAPTEPSRLEQEAANFKPAPEPTVDDLFNPKNAKPPVPLEDSLKAEADAFLKRKAEADTKPDAEAPTEPEFDPAAHAHVEDLKSHIDDVTKDWVNRPDIEVVHSVNDIADPADREQALKEGASDALGFKTPDGKVKIIAGNIKDKDEASAVVYHEALGHHGLSQRFGDSLDDVLKSMYDNNVGSFKADVDDWLEKNPEAYRGDPKRLQRGAEEVLAEKSENGQIDPSVLDRVKNTVKQYGRQSGLNLRYSDREIHTILGMAHDAVINGKGRDVAANGFRYARVWHGSPYDFDRFDHSKMGTGEGHQVFGWGTYLTETRGVAEGYRDRIGEQRQVSKGNGRLYEVHVPDDAKWLDWDNPIKDQPHVIAALNKMGYDVHSAEDFKKIGDEEDRLYGVLQKARNNYYGATTEAESREAFKAMKDASDDYDHFQLSQTEGINDEDLGQDVYNKLAIRSSDRDVSTQLNRAGIDGTKYKDAVSRGKGVTDPTHHYVVYDDKTPQIINKYMRRRKPEQDAAVAEGSSLGEHLLSSVYSESRFNDALRTAGKLDDKQITTFAEAKRAAEDLNLSPGKITKGANIGDLGPRLVAMGKVRDEVFDKISKAADDIDKKGFSAESQKKILDQVMTLAAVHARVSSDAGQLGRALNTLKIVKNGSLRVDQMLEEFKKAGGPQASLADQETFMKFVKSLQTQMANGNPAGATALVGKTLKPYWEDYLLTGRHAAMLSAPSTHYKNSVDNLNLLVRDLVEHTVVGLTPGTNVSLPEVQARWYGLMKTALDTSTYRDTWNAFKTGAHGPNNKVTIQSARIPGVSKILDALTAEDVFFRNFNQNMHMNGLGVREAQRRGYKGQAAFREGTNLALNPTPGMLTDAKKYTERALLVDNDSAVVNKLNMLKGRQGNLTGVERTLRFVANEIFPFVRVQDRMIARKLSRSPLALLSGDFWRDVKSGDPAQRDVAIGRALMGSALVAYYIHAANKGPTEEGHVEGVGPLDYKKQQALQASGYMPDSVVHNGRMEDATAVSTSFRPWDLHNNMATDVASLVQGYKAGKTSADDYIGGLKGALAATIKTLGSNSFVGNIQPMIDAYEGITSGDSRGDASVGNFVGGLVASHVVPNVVRGLNNSVLDPVQRTSSGDKSINDRIAGMIQAGIPSTSVMKGVPVLEGSQGLPIKYDSYGRELPKGKTLTGIGNNQVLDKDPTAMELRRLEDTDTKPVVTAAPSTIRVNGASKKLSGQEYADYQRVSGQMFYSQMKEVMTYPGWKTADDDTKKAAIKEVLTDSRKAAREQLYPGEE